MQRYTQLKLTSFRERFFKEYPQKWHSISIEVASARGGGFPGIVFLGMQEYVSKELKQGISEILASEKQALLSKPESPEQNHFAALKEELTKTFYNFVDSVHEFILDATHTWVASGRGNLPPNVMGRLKDDLRPRLVARLKL